MHQDIPQEPSHFTGRSLVKPMLIQVAMAYTMLVMNSVSRNGSATAL